MDLTCVYAFVVAGIHAHFGLQVVAVVVEALVRAHEAAFDAKKEREGMNYLLIMAHLYNLQVLNCTLIFDLVNYMTANLDGFAISQIHIILKNVGLHMRSDDPKALKDMIMNVQHKAQRHTAREERLLSDPNSDREHNWRHLKQGLGRRADLVSC